MQAISVLRMLYKTWLGFILGCLVRCGSHSLSEVYLQPSTFISRLSFSPTTAMQVKLGSYQPASLQEKLWE